MARKCKSSVLMFMRIWILHIMLFISMSPTYAAEKQPEYVVKAAFLYNFAKFIEWPSNISHIQLCILGKNPFGASLADLEGKNIGSRKFQVLSISTPNAQCNITFISASEKNTLAKFLEEMQAFRGITVADSIGFAQQGVMINFYLDDNDAVRFEVNPEAISAAKLPVSAKLIQLGKVVRSNK